MSASPTSPTGFQVTRSGSLKLDEFVLIEPEEAGMPSSEYCLQDDSRPRQFYPYGSIWSKKTLLGKAVTSLVSSISPSLNRATIVPCRNTSNGRGSKIGDAAAATSTRRAQLTRTHAVTSFGEETDPRYIEQKIKLHSQDGSCDEYLLLIDRRDSCEMKSEDVMGSKKEANCIPVDIDPYLCDGVLQTPKPIVNNDTTLQIDSSLDSAYGSQKGHSSLPVSSTSSYMSLRGDQISDDSVTSEVSVFSRMTSSIKMPVDGDDDSHTLTPDPADDPTRSTGMGGLSKIPQNAVAVAQDHQNHISELPPVSHASSKCAPVLSSVANTVERDKAPGRKSDTSEMPRHKSYSGRKPSYIIKKVNKALSEPAPSDIVSCESLHELKELQLHEQNPSANPEGSSDLPSITLTEEQIKSKVKQHCIEFVQFTNWKALLPRLEAQNLLDHDTTHYLLNPDKSHQDKGLYYLLQVLPYKGHDAYTRFYCCIADETEHSGHLSLVKILQTT